MRAYRTGPIVSVFAGCGKPPPVRPGHWYSAETADRRENRIRLPQSYDPGRPTPLILSYHGATRNITHQIPRGPPQRPGVQQRPPGGVPRGRAAGRPGPAVHEVAGGAGRAGGSLRRGVHSRRGRRGQALLCVDVARVYNPGAELHGGAEDVISFHGGLRKGACLPAICHWAKDWARRNRLDLRDVVVPVGGTRSGVRHMYSDGLVTLVYAADDVDTSGCRGSPEARPSTRTRESWTILGSRAWTRKRPV
ncbi:hypothetical protein DL765_002493 [Monosporascus sp. GIB2]|nr:hypothetical protein DL765_002493 [Monosporascus sp. GIB2]